jgi:hypothetical protein
MTTPIEPYVLLERRALRDLAARVLADPNAHDEHVTAARRRLMERAYADPESAAIGLIGGVSAEFLTGLRALVRAEQARRGEGVPASPGVFEA